MNHYVIFLPMLDEEKSKTYRPEHLDYLKRMKEEKKVWAYGRFTDGAGGMVIYLAESLEEARKYPEVDPYVKQGARRMEIHEWAMADGPSHG